jgi:phosphoglycolate phosphatase-like HAD superfamily hydrolase
VVKRLAAVETLGSTTVICTDKTGTLTENRMRVTKVWMVGVELDATVPTTDTGAVLLATAAAACTTADAPSASQEAGSGDPTELALLRFASDLGDARTSDERRAARHAIHHFDGELKRMSTLDQDGDVVVVHVKGATESVLPLCTDLLTANGTLQQLDNPTRSEIGDAMDRYAADREQAEAQLTFLGLVAMVDPPRAGVAAAVTAAHRAGMRIHVVTGDYGLTAAAVARSVGIGRPDSPVLSGGELDALDAAGLDAFVAGPGEIVFARTSPESKLRICEALKARGEVVAMTGDGVNDAPALRHADIGIAMGRSGTDVAREAATMVLTDDNFATIVAAIDAGRRVYDNVRKFVLYIFAHAVPEVIPFLVFALSGGAIPLPLTVLQILAIDLGTETLPALALGREPAEPGIMGRPPAAPRGRHHRQGPAATRAGPARGGLRHPGDGRVPAHAPPGRMAPQRPDRRRYAAPPRLPAGDDDHVRRHCRLPDRHRLRSADRPRLTVHDRCLVQPPAAVGDRLRARVHSGAHLRPAAAPRLRNSVPQSHAAPHRGALPRHRLGERRAPPVGPTAATHPRRWRLTTRRDLRPCTPAPTRGTLDSNERNTDDHDRRT